MVLQKGLNWQKVTKIRTWLKKKIEIINVTIGIKLDIILNAQKISYS